MIMNECRKNLAKRPSFTSHVFISMYCTALEKEYFPFVLTGYLYIFRETFNYFSSYDCVPNTVISCVMPRCKGKRKEDIRMATYKYKWLVGTTQKMSLISLWGQGRSTYNLLNIDHPSKILLFTSFLHFSVFSLILLRILFFS